MSSLLPHSASESSTVEPQVSTTHEQLMRTVEAGPCATLQSYVQAVREEADFDDEGDENFYLPGSNIFFPRWTRPWYSHALCAEFNSPRAIKHGFSDTDEKPRSDCAHDSKHACFVCGERDHGMLTEADDGHWFCPKLRELTSQLEKLMAGHHPGVVGFEQQRCLLDAAIEATQPREDACRDPSDNAWSDDGIPEWMLCTRLSNGSVLNIDLRAPIHQSKRKGVFSVLCKGTSESPDPLAPQDWHPNPDEVAVKLIYLSHSKEDAWRQVGFLSQAPILRLNVPGVVTHYHSEMLQLEHAQLSSARGSSWYYCTVMECVEQNLWQFVSREPALDDKQVKSALFQLLHAYNTCHTRIVEGEPRPLYHRDVKPQNVLVSGVASSLQFKLCDFRQSIIGVDESANETAAVPLKEEKRWRAPETYAVSPLETPRLYKLWSADVWALGVVLFYLATHGAALFNNPREVQQSVLATEHLRCLRRHELHPLLLDLIMRMTCFKPEERVTMAEGLSHPATWSVLRVLDFLKQFNDEPLAPAAATPALRLRQLSVVQLVQNLDAHKPFPVDWPTLPLMAKSYILDYAPQGGGAAKLLLAIRNLQSHAVQKGVSLEELGTAITKLFPQLILHAWAYCVRNDLSEFLLAR